MHTGSAGTCMALFFFPGASIVSMASISQMNLKLCQLSSGCGYLHVAIPSAQPHINATQPSATSSTYLTHPLTTHPLSLLCREPPPYSIQRCVRRGVEQECGFWQLLVHSIHQLLEKLRHFWETPHAKTYGHSIWLALTQGLQQNHLQVQQLLPTVVSLPNFYEVPEFSDKW